MLCLLEQVKGWFLIPTLLRQYDDGKRKLMDSNCNSRQRHSAEGDKCPQRELEQHGRASIGRTGGLQSKTVMEIPWMFLCGVFFFFVCFVLIGLLAKDSLYKKIENMQYYTRYVQLHNPLSDTVKFEIKQI